MKPNFTKYLSLICLLLFSVQVVLLYANNALLSNLSTASMPTLFMYEPNKEVHNPIESSTDNPEQEEKEESQESEENEETEELEVSSSNVANQKECLQFSDMNYYYLFRPSDGINQEHYCPPECKIYRIDHYLF